MATASWVLPASLELVQWTILNDYKEGKPRASGVKIKLQQSPWIGTKPVTSSWQLQSGS